MPHSSSVAPHLLLALVTCVGAGARQALAQDTAFDAKAHYAKRDTMIPMRDGVKLFTILYTPRDTTKSYPILLVRTPYSIRPYEPDSFRTRLGPSQEFDRDGYIFAFQDVRGKFRSEGEFEVMRPFDPTKRTPQDTDESSDTYDTIDWLLKNVPRNNGRVGMWGISYPGWQTVMGMMGAHPALKAASPQASPSDMYIGDDFHHNGAFRLMYAFSWLAGNARTRAGQSTTSGAAFDYGTPDGYRFFMEAGAPARIDSLYFHGQVPAWNDFMRHPNYDEYWKAQNVLKDLPTVPAQLPILNVAGWFDAEDFYGPMSIYYGLEKAHPSNRSILAVGPWLHGGWNSMPGDQLGNITFGSQTSRHFQTDVQFPFFQCHLKDRCEKRLPEATVFETGSNVWRTYETWPPRGATERKLYFHPNGGLSFDAPRATGFDEYVHDPNTPVPFSAETRTTQGHLWMIEDQRFAAARPDVLVYETEPLTEDVTIAGPIMANLYASTSGTDADWVVKLIDVLPGDTPDNEPNPGRVRMGHFQMLLAGEVFRAKYRDSYERPSPLVPGQVTHFEFDLRDRYHTFKKGHRIMVQVQSSWFPVIDRNPGTFTNIYHAKPSDYRRTTQRIHRSPGRASHLALQVIESPGPAVQTAAAPSSASAPQAQTPAQSSAQPPAQQSRASDTTGTRRDYSAPLGAPYTAENVTVPTPMGHTLAGTLTLPRGASRENPVPAVVTMTGSGAQDRDEALEMLPGYRPFRQIADSLGRRGIAVLRMDDRGFGGSTGNHATATSADFAEDIRAGLAYLRTRPEIDASRLGLVGHSEGGLIGPLVAVKEPQLRALALLAAPSWNGRKILEFQIANLIKHDTTLTPAARDSALAGIPARIDSMKARPWMAYFIDHDVLGTARQVKTPVLILNAGTDQQVTPEQTAELAAAMREGGNRDVTARVLPNLNHLFIYDPVGFPGGYTRLTRSAVEPVAVGTVVEWLVRKLK